MKTNESIVQEEHLPQFERQIERAAGEIEITEDYAGTPYKLEEVLERAEKEYILRVLKQCENNKTKAAKIMDVSLRSLYYKLEKYAIE